MRILHFVLAAAVVVVPPIAVASAEQPVVKQKQKQHRICRREPVTGTRMAGPRVCMTQAEWDGVGDQAKEDLGASQNRQRVIMYGPGGRSTCPTGVPC